MNQKARIIELQRSNKIAKDALERIRYGCRDHVGVAETALDAMRPLAPVLPAPETHGQLPPRRR